MLSEENDKTFYVYVYLDPRKPGEYNFSSISFEYAPFYIGKGKLNRDTYHLKYGTKNSLFQNKLNKIISSGLIPIIRRIFVNLTENESLSLERNLINEIGRININEGYLCNLTNGGEGVSGLVQTKEHRLKNSLGNRGTYEERYGIETAKKLKEKRSAQLLGNTYGKNLSKESRKKISQANSRPWLEKYGENYIKERLICYYVISPSKEEFIIFSNDNLYEFAVYCGLPKTSLVFCTYKSAKMPNYYKEWYCAALGNKLEFEINLKEKYINAKIWKPEK